MNRFAKKLQNGVCPYSALLRVAGCLTIDVRFKVRGMACRTVTAFLFFTPVLSE